MRSLNRVILHNRRGGSIGGGRGRGHGAGGGIWMRALDGASGCLPSPRLAFMLPLRASRYPLYARRMRDVHAIWIPERRGDANATGFPSHSMSCVCLVAMNR